MKMLNIFGQDMKLYYDQETQYRTKFGLFLSFVFYLITGSCMFLIGRDFFKRENPILKNYTEISSNRNVYELTELDFDIFFKFTDWRYNQSIPIEDIVKFEIDFSGNFSARNDYHRCNETDIKNEVIKNRINISEYFCINKENKKIGGNFDSLQYYISFNIIKCSNNCIESDEVINQHLENIHFDLYYPEVYYNFSNYETGIDTNIKQISQLLNFNKNLFNVQLDFKEY